MINQDEIEEITEETDTEVADADEVIHIQEDMEILEQQRIQRRRERMAVMRQKKRRQELIRRYSPVIGAGVIVLALAVWGLVRLAGDHDRESESGEVPGGESYSEARHETEEREKDRPVKNGKSGQYVSADKTGIAGEESRPQRFLPDGSSQESLLPAEEAMSARPVVDPFTFSPRATEHTVGFPEEGRGVYSTNGILIDVGTEEIIACREPYQRINPASMTKILTLLVAAEQVSDLQDTFIMTAEIANYSYVNDCSIAGFGVGEAVTVEELMYGTILPSGADAAMALAEYVAGSQEAFVELMNQKLEQLGLSDTTHFTNCVGLYDEDHYSTVYDMALILKAASDNELCRRVLSSRKYATSVPSEQQPEGILLSNLFLRRIEDKDTHGEVLCGKTGYVSQAGSCAASLAADPDGREYICVTTGSISSWACIYDHVELYQAFLPAQ